MNWIEKLDLDLPHISSEKQQYLKDYTYTKTGGICDVVVFPANIEEVRQIVLWSKKNHIKLTVLGNASNVIVKDSGIKGIVLFFDKMTNIEQRDNYLTIESGVKLVDLAKFALSKSLTGLEFSCGIPGNLGGGLFMNAGAYGGELKDVIDSVTVVDLKGNVKTYNNEEMQFSYRHSKIQDEFEIIVQATVKLSVGNKDDIEYKMNELTQLRESRQPLDYPSCGSVFKRPVGYFAGDLIQRANLQGYRIGGVEVSKKHAGFMVNVNQATAEDYKNLITYVQKVVYEKFNVQLETEVKFIGE